MTHYKYSQIIISFFVIIFLLGLHVYANNKIRLVNPFGAEAEAMQNKGNITPTCGNVLLKRGEHIYLYNTNDTSDAIPLHFNNLDEYVQYVESQRSQNIFKKISSPHELTQRPVGFVQPVIDSSRTSKTFNVDLYPGFDPHGQDIGVYNELDKIHGSTAQSANSDNAMDPNWGGVEHTENAIESGKYDDRRVTKATYFTPNAQFIKGLGNRSPPPSYITQNGDFHY
jgi:hypothetical protein